MDAPNPYATPGAKLADPPPGPGSPIKAVLFGLLVDVGGTVVASLILGIAYGMYLATSGLAGGDMQAAAESYRSGPMFYIGALVGLMFSVLGGHVCGRIARQSEYTLGVILGVLSVLSGLLLSWNQLPALTSTVLAVLGFAAVVLGAHWAKARNRRERRQ